MQIDFIKYYQKLKESISILYLIHIKVKNMLHKINNNKLSFHFALMLIKLLETLHI